MPIFAFFIIISLMLYFFYKIKYFRTHRPMEKRWLAGKASIALGLFVALYGINRFFVHSSTVTTIVGILFILIGIASAYNGFRQYKHFLPLAIEEAEKLK